ncbi:5'-3' exoribonuclease 1 [Podosphaera aphanis]|nr:5'-3' exoribonuclease 1 [Podosphaera aphanis]
MGIPKFFRWMSERYPAISQVIAENRIPEFDCLYLDMNGIIHNCTHKDSDDTTFRMTEEQMFIAIFNYIELLFGKIKPKQLFFMAIDGVAPRAKMNQQRARRFRTALDVETAHLRAVREGKEIPDQEPFDSNSITPGTEFMHKLTLQLKYFINKKVSEDVDWQGVEIVLSGHEVPGEGEHKIMEYIRLAKAQPDYDSNVRHCLYGLDADLIMLGLLSHDPHFCLLREEVTFGRASKAKAKELEHQDFYLMHICVVREYLELEFQELKKPGILRTEFDLERIIDDFILMAFFVGNDFLPNLPSLHINEGALAMMFKVYKTTLPKIDGYINNGGVINMDRLAVLLEELSHVEYRFFESDSSDQKWFKSKQMAKEDIMVRGKAKTKITMTSTQRDIWLLVKDFAENRSDQPLDLPSTLAAADRKFVQDVADNMHLEWKIVENNDGDRHMQLSFPPPKESKESEETEDEDEDLSLVFRSAVQIYDNAETVDNSIAEVQAEMDRLYEVKFQEWKDSYYLSKFDWDRKEEEEELTKLCENYVQGLQWVLYYYYRGVASWPWYYKYHYSPMISDVIKGLKADVSFELGQPFHPFEQLMGVLPDRSKKIVPNVYHDLMTNPESPIIDFYPREFELDMNGKKMEWEAVVKIPFIDEKRLLAAMAPKNKLLTDEEKKRNEFGVTLKYKYDPKVSFTYRSSLVGIFPNIQNCHCVEIIFDLPTIEGLDYHVGLMEGVKLGDAALAGFPSLSVLPYNASLCYHGVNVFQSESRNESMIITLEDSALRSKVKTATMKLGQKVFVGYPYLQEARVVKVSDELFDYLPSDYWSSQPIQKPHTPREIEEFNKKAERIENNYSKRLGILIGPVESITHVEILKGLRKTDDGAAIKEYANIPGIETDYASQIIVDKVISEDKRFIEHPAIPMAVEFPPGTRAFYLSYYHYGRPLEVITHYNNCAEIWLSIAKTKEPDFGHDVIREHGPGLVYTPAFAVAQMLHLNPLVLSKITSSFVVSSEGNSRLNLGLNLKFESKKLKVLGYTQKSDKGWEYSHRAIELLMTYMTKFPEFFAGVQSNAQANNFKATDFYPAEIAETKIREIVAWLKSIESKSFEKVSLDSEQLDPEIVKAIEQAADAALMENSAVEYKRFKNVPRNALMKPSDAEHRLGNQKFALGDRVVYVQDSGRVPIATRGIVIGISRTTRLVLLDVLFDVTFMSGTSLGGRCSPFRGSTVPISSVINLTNKQVVIGKNFSNVQSSPRTNNSQNNGPIYAGGGRGLYRDATTPAPIRGSFRGAVTGQGRGNFTRGRGPGLNRGVYPHA